MFMAGALIGSSTAKQFRQLRERYDAAFRKLVKLQQERRNTQQPASDVIQSIEAEVRCYRDQMADLLLKNAATGRAETPQVQEAAYFIWLNAGQPSGTSVCDWMNARKQILA